MSSEPSSSSETPRRPRRSPGPLPPPPPGVDVRTRIEAAAFMGVSLGTFGVWERDGRVTIPRYRAAAGTGRTIFYAAADLKRLREEFRKLEEPYPDPDRPGVCRVPIQSDTQRMEAIIDAEDLPKVEGKRWNWHRRGGSDKVEVILATVTERAVSLKRVIMGLEAPGCKDQTVGFVNGDPLDCRRENLIILSRAEVNLRKTKKTPQDGGAATSKYRGVGWDAKRRLWKAQIGTREMHRMLGRFRDEAQAAAAYDVAARAMFGPSAPLNFPDGNVPAPTFLSPDGELVREKHKYRVPPPLPSPPPGEAMVNRKEAAEMLDVSEGTFGVWERAGNVAVPRYRVKSQTGTPILYAASDIARLRAELDKVGRPYPDPHPARAGVWRVPLRTLAGYVEALIDEVDLPIVEGKSWNFVAHSGGGAFSGTIVQVGPRNIARSQLKRFILDAQDRGQAVRILHANGNPLDCRRENLVVGGPDKTTRRCFKILQRGGRPTSSRFKGVCWIEREGKWQSQIRVDDRSRLLGMFDDEEDAAFAYDEAAREVWGEEARVNFPRPGELPSAAAPVAPADLSPDAKSPAARMPGKPDDFDAVLNKDGSVTLSWRSADSAASAGVTFKVSRRLPGQREFMRIGTARGSTSQTRRPTFTDATVPAPHIAADGAGAEYLVQAARGGTPGDAGDVLVVKFDRDGALQTPRAITRAA